MVGGDHDGEPFVLLPWERRFIGGSVRRRGVMRRYQFRGVTARARSARRLLARLLTTGGHFTGRVERWWWSRRRSLRRASSSRTCSQCCERRLADGSTRRYGGRRTARTRRRWSTGHLVLGIRAIGGDPKTAHGLRPALALLDEPAQWEPARSDKMLAAIRTGLGKVPGSRLIALGTRPLGDHWFAEMLREAAYSQVHAAGEDDPPFAMSTIRKANPSLPHLQSLKKRLMLERDEAKRNPASAGLVARIAIESRHVRRDGIAAPRRRCVGSSRRRCTR